MPEKTVDAYIAGLDGWKGEVAARLREVILTAAPEVEEAIKWAQPVYSHMGPFAYFKAFKLTVNCGFWRGVELDDPQGILKGSGEKMRHVPIRSVDDVDAESLTAFIQQAMALNESKGDPTC